MAKLRKFSAYRGIERPYTRVSKYKKKAYIRMSPTPKVVRFTTGTSSKKFSHSLKLNSKSLLQVRDNALESARQVSNRLLETTLGPQFYRLNLRVYPFHILRENPLAQGAGADRFSTGMSHAFGKPIGIAAQVKKGQTIFQVDTDEKNVLLAKEALNRAASKLPCACTIQISKNA
jgi:large subunit ribosomal protein L10e